MMKPPSQTSSRPGKTCRFILFALGVVLLFAISFTAMQAINNPKRLIGNYLEHHHYTYDLAASEIIKLGPTTYELLDPPLDSATQTPLAKWQLLPFSRFLYFAEPMDLSPVHTVHLSITLSEEDYQQLVQAAQQANLSLEDYAAQHLK